MIVVDASALVTALIDDGTDGRSARTRLRGQVLAAPALVDLEVTSVLRRLVLSGQQTARRAEQAVADLVALPMQRAPHLSLLARCWALRDSFSVYDASYVALAELSGSVLLTADAKLATSPGPRCAIEVLQRPGTST